MLIEGGSLRRVYRKPCLIIYQRRHRRCCRSIPSHQFAAVPPCSQRRHILIYPNVLHTNNPSQFPNRANHPIALTLPAIQGALPPPPPFLLDGSWPQVSNERRTVHPPRCSTPLGGEEQQPLFTTTFTIDRSTTEQKPPTHQSHTQDFVTRLVEARDRSF